MALSKRISEVVSGDGAETRRGCANAPSWPKNGLWAQWPACGFERHWSVLSVRTCGGETPPGVFLVVYAHSEQIVLTRLICAAMNFSFHLERRKAEPCLCRRATLLPLICFERIWVGSFCHLSANTWSHSFSIQKWGEFPPPQKKRSTGC